MLLIMDNFQAVKKRASSSFYITYYLWYNKNKRQVLNLKKEELIKFWRNTSDNDFRTMMNLFNSNDYSWSL
ncbi:hypothetical protein FTV88_2769 [Heliorestis convoluta]|uniref:Uncharacterized protein n=1 Tax=Heliorestis convoluta TaxID=356322 RepID=A0A5Q2N1H6_9FIRM|nr:hypothetical protein FTV88_2769 [Heliorestis convoluta]